MGPFIGTFLIAGLPDPLHPVKLKNGHFWVFLDFWSNGQIEGLSPAFPTIPNLSRLDRAPASYDPGSGERPENFALTLFGVQIRYINDVNAFSRFLGCSIR